jgi:valyl-tRNA synthetase
MPVLAHVLENSLRLLHPFMPFITEEIWQNLKAHLDTEAAESIMISPYPIADESCLDEAAEKRMAVVIDIVRSIRNTRAEFKVEPSRWIEALVAANEARLDIASQSRAIERLARVNPLTIIDTSYRRPDKVKTIVLEGAEVILPMTGMVDVEAERERLKKESEVIQAEIARLEARLNDENFISKAPPDVVEREREKLATQRDRLMRLGERLSELG